MAAPGNIDVSSALELAAPDKIYIKYNSFITVRNANVVALHEIEFNPEDIRLAPGEYNIENVGILVLE